MKNKIFFRIAIVMAISMIFIIIAFGSFYTYWNNASPKNTCASCHEIQSRVHSMAQSSHRELSCSKCHGTALSNGIHSMKEKAMMVITHLNNDRVEGIRMNEEQLLAVMDKCKDCHTAEFSDWQSGGHSVTYSDIFLNETHNKTEQLNFDCLRCHGMFFEGKTTDLVEPIDTKGPWEMKMPEKADQPAIPCMACHQVHSEGEIAMAPDHSDPKSIFYSHSADSIANVVSFYDHSEKMHIPALYLPKLKVTERERFVEVSDDPHMRNCVQCHASNGWHEAGTGDDRTPTGVHEGLSCLACHSPHSNNARNSCNTCHPKISNCGLNVTKMNTTYLDKNSPHNIHTVGCKDCHHKFIPQAIASSKQNSKIYEQTN